MEHNKKIGTIIIVGPADDTAELVRAAVMASEPRKVVVVSPEKDVNDLIDRIETSIKTYPLEMLRPLPMPSKKQLKNFAKQQIKKGWKR